MKKREVFFAAAVVLLLGFLLCGCKSVEKAMRTLKEKGKLAEVCADNFPVKTDSFYIPGQTTVIHHTDTMPGDSIPCPVLPGHPPIVVHCPPTIHTRDTIIRIDTFTVTKENTAEIAALKAQMYAYKIDSVKAWSTTERLKIGRNTWRTICLWTWGVILVLGGGVFLFKTQTAWFTNIIKSVTNKS